MHNLGSVFDIQLIHRFRCCASLALGDPQFLHGQSLSEMHLWNLNWPYAGHGLATR